DTDLRHLIAFDMGGTTAKICIVDDGEPFTTWDLEVDRAERFSSGSGLPLKIPSFEMIEIGAGGGSLAHINELGLLKVGPSSAGSTPGPCCYGRGGDQPTVTDALLVLGYLDPGYFLGGRLALNQAAAEEAIGRQVGSVLGISVEEAALGIYRIACGQMAEATRVQLAEHGKDPRRYSLVAFGGAGPVHACEVARQLKLPRVIVPPAAGIMSAYGLLMAPLAFSLVQSYPSVLSEVDRSSLDEQFALLEDRARAMLLDAGVPAESIQLQRRFDLKYTGQKHTIEVELDATYFNADFDAALLEEFERLYVSQHGRANRGLELYLESIKVRGLGQVEASAGLMRGADASLPDAIDATRPVRFLGTPAPVPAQILRRSSLNTGIRYTGPAIIEEPETTTVIGPLDQFEVDDRGNLVVFIGTSSTNHTFGDTAQEAQVGFTR
ncbi:MAG: hydantoinase/oxoprolinase family protein, partial [Thermomicrobiales bacterium]|nr:hydantoinase/oxoprolinase family protein [Thermomicrobiales bacterium]